MRHGFRGWKKGVEEWKKRGEEEVLPTKKHLRGVCSVKFVTNM